jgi:hypothetical protein
MHNVYHASYGQHPAWGPDPEPEQPVAPVAPGDPAKKAAQALMAVGSIVSVGGYAFGRPITAIAGGMVLGIGAYMFPWGDWMGGSAVGKWFSQVK